MRKSSWRSPLALCLLAVAVVVPGAYADEQGSDINRLSWLAGVWQSPLKDGAQTEYVYVPLFNGQMLSTMFAIKDGQATRYELRVIKLDGNQVVFHELGFKPDLSPADPVPLRPLLSQDKTHTDFQDMKITKVGQDAITLQLTLHPPTGAPRNVTLQLRRVMRFTPAH